MRLKQIKLAINNLVIQQFPTIEIQSTDVREGFKRPSFFVQIDNVNKDTRLYVSEKSMTVRIYYFPESHYDHSLEIMDIQDDLESIFNLNFPVEGRTITIEETRSQTIDGVLEFEFDFEFIEDIQDEDTSELMGELELDRNV